MLRGESSRKINDAIQAGLALCRQSAAPIVSLALYVNELHASDTWHDSDVSKIESAIRHILARVVRVTTVNPG